MKIFIDSCATVTLLDGDDLTHFSVQSTSSDQDSIDSALRLSGAGHFDGAFAWISPQWILDSAKPHADEDWAAGFERMREFAASRGWTDPATGSIRGHLDR